MTDKSKLEAASLSLDGLSAEEQEYRLRVAQTPYFSGNMLIDEQITLSSGKTLPQAVVAYDTWGTLSAQRDNVILIEHALSGNSHVADAYREGEFREGWWNRIVGPGKAIDTDKYFVVCANVLGGCSGSTGPSSKIPGTDRRWGMDFPVVTVKDMVVVQKRFLEKLGIEQLVAVIGGSLGGMQTLVWAKKFPEMANRCIAIASTWRTSAQSIAFNEVGRKAIINDPLFKNGQYDPANPPAHGLAIARMIGHITYLCEESMNRKFGRQLMGDKPGFTMDREFQVESYLNHQGYKFVDRFDANSYLYITRAIDYFSLCHSCEGITKRFANSPVKMMLLSFDSDWLFPTNQTRDLLNALTAAGVETTFAELEYPFGHDSFLLEVPKQSRYLRAFLGDSPADDEPTHTRHHKSIDSRPDLVAISENVSSGSRVLDLGCADGLLLDWLRAYRNCTVYGVDIDEDEVIATASRDIPVLKHDLDEGLPMFPDDSFDVVILSLAIMQVKKPLELLKEMLRVGRKIIVTFPNFGYWRTRFHLLLKGRMPIGRAMPYSWYETPNIHHTTLLDFRDFVNSNGGKIEREAYLHVGTGGEIKRISSMPNMRADTVIVVASATDAPQA